MPSDAEWTLLENYVSSQSQYVCGSTSTYIAKSLAGTIGWNAASTIECAVGNDENTNNITDFGVHPAGSYAGSYGGVNYYAYFWSSTEYSNNDAYSRDFAYNIASVKRSNNHYKYCAFSVRCVKD